jgi:hypothetical protein
MERSILHWVCVCALVALLVGGCSDETAAAGGTGGDGGTGGSGGADPCERITCGPDTECRIDGVCNASARLCDYTLVADRTTCTNGECLDGVCARVGAFLCTEQGIRDAIAEGGGPHFFACGGPRTVLTEAEIAIDNDVILDGEGALTLSGNDEHRVFSVPEGVSAQLRGIGVTRGAAVEEDDEGGGGINSRGTLALVDCVVSNNRAVKGGGIVNYGSLTLSKSTVTGNRADVGAGIYNTGELVIEDSQLSHFKATESLIYSASEGISIVNSGLFAGQVTVCGELIVQNSTLDGVSVSLGRRGSDGCDCVGSAVLTNATVQGEIEEAGCGGQATLFGTIVMGECSVSTVSNGYNIESRGNTCGLDHETDQTDVTEQDLKPDCFGTNGQYKLGKGSVGLDVIPASHCLDVDGEPLIVDQRGEPRPETGGTMCDVGAIEMQPDDAWPQCF